MIPTVAAVGIISDARCGPEACPGARLEDPNARDQPIGHIRPGSLFRNVAAALIAGVWRRRTILELRDRLAAMPARDEALVVSGVLLALFHFAVHAGRLHEVGLLLYFLAVVLIVP